MTDQNRIAPLVLIIEDEALLSRMYSKKLSIDGYKCIVAPDGEIGVRIAKQELPDIIMLDVMMPNKDGITTLAELKADEQTKPIPVIMLSNVSENKYVEEALEMGAVSYLVKSDLLPAEVVAAVKEKLIAAGKQSLLSKIGQ